MAYIQSHCLGDHATGTSVLADLDAKMGEASYPPTDRNELWGRLGIRTVSGKAVFDNHAPLAPIRETVTIPDRHQIAPAQFRNAP